MACVVFGCKSHTSRKENTDGIATFHRFPKDEKIKNEWLRRLCKRNWTPKKHSHICSMHFTLDSFVPNDGIKYRRLYDNAVPSLLLSDEIRKATTSEAGPYVTVIPIAHHPNYNKPLSNTQENYIPGCKRRKTMPTVTNIFLRCFFSGHNCAIGIAYI